MLFGSSGLSLFLQALAIGFGVGLGWGLATFLTSRTDGCNGYGHSD